MNFGLWKQWKNNFQGEEMLISGCYFYGNQHNEISVFEVT